VGQADRRHAIVRSEVVERKVRAFLQGNRMRAPKML
jgi:hypothetical protein